MRDSKASLKNVRVLKKNMLFLQSYDEHINRTVLNTTSLYDICGPVEKIKVKENFKNHTAYVTFQHAQAAASAFLSLHHANQRMKILFGTVQYCKYFLRKAECRNQHCVFLHLRDKKNEIVVSDEIEEDVYDQHYRMALQIAEDQAFQTLKLVLSNTQYPDNLIRVGALKAAEVLNILIEPKLQPSPLRKLSDLQQSFGSTEEGETREQLPPQPSTVDRTLQHDSEPQDPDPQRACCQQNQSKNNKIVEQSSLNLQEYINIQLIKRLLRNNTSKMNFGPSNSQSSRFANLMLYSIVKSDK